MAPTKKRKPWKITASVIRALEIIRDKHPHNPSQFGHFMWPDHPSWDKISKAGDRGSTYGGGMNLMSGGFLGRLHRMGLIHRIYREDGRIAGYDLTEKGHEALTNNNHNEG